MGDMNAAAVLIQLGAVKSWSPVGGLYKMEVDLKKSGPFRNAIRAIYFGHHTSRPVKYGHGTIVLSRTPNWDDPCTQVASWDSLATPPKI